LLNKQKTKEALIANAYILLDEGQAELGFENVLSFNKKTSEAICGLGDLAFITATQIKSKKDKQYEIADDFYQKAIAMNSFIKKFYLKRGKVLLKLHKDRWDGIVYYYKAFNMHIEVADSQKGPIVEGGATRIAEYFLNEYEVDKSYRQNGNGGLYETEIDINQDLFDYYLSMGTSPEKNDDEITLKNKIISLKIALKINESSAEARKFMTVALLLQDENEKTLIKNFLLNGNYGLANIHYNKIPSLQGKDLDIEKGMGDYFYDIIRHSTAIEHYKLFIKLGGKDIVIEKRVGDYFYNMKQYDDAMHYYKLFIKHEGIDTDEYKRLGDYFHSKEGYDGEARDFYEMFIEHGGASQDVERKLGNFYANIDDQKSAAHYEKFFELGGEDRNLRKALGDYYYNNDEKQKAELHYTQFLADEGDDADVERNLGDYYYEKQKFGSAKYIYNRYLKRNDDEDVKAKLKEIEIKSNELEKLGINSKRHKLK
jgi:tetratricopeptide (TPR) repeat protein